MTDLEKDEQVVSLEASLEEDDIATEDYEYDEDYEESEKEERPHSQPKTIFIAAFFVTLLLLAVVGVIWWMFGSDSPAASTDSETTVTTSKTVPSFNTTPTKAPSLALFTPADRLATAVYIADYDGNLQSVALTMIHADTADEKISVVGLPAETVIDAEQSKTLAALYNESIESSQQALNAYLVDKDDRIAVKYYVVVTYDHIESIIQKARARGDSFLFNVENELREDPDDGGNSIYIPAGKQSLTEKQVADLFRYTAWPHGSQQRAQKHAEFIFVFLSETITGADKKELSDTHLMVYHYSLDTDFTANEYQTASAVFRDIAGYKDGALCRIINTDGAFSQSATQFELADDTLNDIKERLIR